MRNQKPNIRSQKSEVRLGIAIVFLLFSVATAQAVQVWVPDSMSGDVGDTVEVPILVSGQSGQNVIAADITMGFGESVLTATDSSRLGSAASGWMVSVNSFSCSLRVAMASANALTAGDTLLVVKMVVEAADTSSIWFSRCRLNEGLVACTTHAGKFYGSASGLAEGRGPDLAGAMLSLFPNPAQDRVNFRCSYALVPGTRVEICGADGRIVKTLPASTVVFWDCRNEQGTDVPAGVYLCRLATSGSRGLMQKLVLLR